MFLQFYSVAGKSFVLSLLKSNRNYYPMFIMNKPMETSSPVVAMVAIQTNHKAG
jgi:hypothetical protein